MRTGAVRIASIFGTRPEAIKMAPIVLKAKSMNEVEQTIITTGQHDQMLEQVLDIFGIIPDIRLHVMKDGEDLNTMMANIMMRIGDILNHGKPDYAIVQGDTATATASALAAYYNGIKVVHVEAGLRTWDKYDPYPEEANRQIIDDISDVYLAPTTTAADNLKAMHVPDSQVTITGNTSIDALALTEGKDGDGPDVLESIPNNHRIVLMTMHRRETQGDRMRRAFEAIRTCVDLYPDVDIIFPVHANPRIGRLAEDVLGGHDRIHLVQPLDLLDMHRVMRASYFIMTDSGGIQEEAPALDKPVLVLREDTERMEGVRTGALELVGVDPDDIVNAFNDLMTNSRHYQSMAGAANPYGDGHAAERTMQAILRDYETRRRP